MRNPRIFSIWLFILISIFSCGKKTSEPEILPSPIFNLPSGNYDFGQLITITCLQDSVEIRYTIDGEEPTFESFLYVNPIIISTIIPNNSNEVTIKAKAFKGNENPSITVAVTYSVTYNNTVATPLISPIDGSLDIGSLATVSCTTPEIEIHYTLNGDTPTVNSPLYGLSISLCFNGSIVVKARAYRSGYNPSSIAVQSYVVNSHSLIPEMLPVQGGTFNNGTSDVTLSSFYLSKFELTQGEYQSTMGENPSLPTSMGDHGVGTTNPVFGVKWYDAIKYCNLRSQAEGLTPCYSYSNYGTNLTNWPYGWNTSEAAHINIQCNWAANGYRLPTEMEWMFAARGGNLTHNYFYSGSNDINAVAWYDGNVITQKTGIVGSKLPNELGFYDMSGNVNEWVWDIPGSYPSGTHVNPHGPSTGDGRLYRGGSWGSDDQGCSISSRDSYPVIFSNPCYGFRVCRASL